VDRKARSGEAKNILGEVWFVVYVVWFPCGCISVVETMELEWLVMVSPRLSDSAGS